jgi:hypothetical protein
MPTFEFDPAKSAANAAKHGIDFEAAQALWLDDQLLELGTVIHGNEIRTLYVGTIGDKCWTAVGTWRGEQLRIISVRRARNSEERAYLRR